MSTLSEFFKAYVRGLAKGMAEEFDLDEKKVYTFIKNYKLNEENKNEEKPQKENKKTVKENKKSPAKKSKEFEPFGKIKTLEQLTSGVNKALGQEKYYNVNTGLTHKDNANMRKKYVMYSSGISGIDGSDELTEALKYFPDGEKPQKEDKKSPAKKKKDEMELKYDDINLVTYIEDGMYVWDDDQKFVFGVINDKGNIVTLKKKDMDELDKRGLDFEHLSAKDVKDQLKKCQQLPYYD